MRVDDMELAMKRLRKLKLSSAHPRLTRVLKQQHLKHIVFFNYNTLDIVI